MQFIQPPSHYRWSDSILLKKSVINSIFLQQVARRLWTACLYRSMHAASSERAQDPWKENGKSVLKALVSCLPHAASSMAWCKPRLVRKDCDTKMLLLLWIVFSFVDRKQRKNAEHRKFLHSIYQSHRLQRKESFQLRSNSH